MAKIVKIKSNFSQIPNSWLRDKNISLKAKGLIATMQSLPDGWDFTVSGLASILKEGREAIRSALMELKEAGYVSWTQTNGNGRFGENIVHLYEKPSQKQPLSENPTAVMPPQYNKDIRNKEEIKKDKGIDTNVSIAKGSEYGNHAINEKFNKFEQMFGYRMKESKANRQAVYNMLRSKSKGEKWLDDMMQLWLKSRSDRYSPRINDFAELQKKYDKLMEWGQREYLRTHPNNLGELTVEQIENMSDEQLIEYYENNKI